MIVLFWCLVFGVCFVFGIGCLFVVFVFGGGSRPHSGGVGGSSGDAQNALQARISIWRKRAVMRTQRGKLILGSRSDYFSRIWSFLMLFVG